MKEQLISQALESIEKAKELLNAALSTEEIQVAAELDNKGIETPPPPKNP